MRFIHNHSNKIEINNNIKDLHVGSFNSRFSLNRPYSVYIQIIQLPTFCLFILNSRGQAKDGIAYGPLTDLPDWSYAGTLTTTLLKEYLTSCILYWTIYHSPLQYLLFPCQVPPSTHPSPLPGPGGY